MLIRNLLLVLLMGIVGFTHAQSAEKLFRIHFNSDEYVLDNNDRKLLDKVYEEMLAQGYSELVLKAHTDQDADANYNVQLSKKRAQSVSDYLQQKGLGKQRISEYAFGEANPVKSNVTEIGKAENRRVDVLLQFYTYNNLTDFLKVIGGETQQKFTFQANKDNTIVAKNGLIIKIPAGSLIGADGKVIKSGELSLVVEEFLKPKDAATQQLSTMAEGKLLESGGMFSVKILQKNKEVKVQEGKNIQVEIPTVNIKKDMQVFVPQVNEMGITEWKNTSAPFEAKPKKQIPLPFVKVDTKVLKEQKVEVPKANAQQLSLQYKAVVYPKKPSKPLRPRKYPMATKYEVLEWYERIFISKATIQKAVEEENARRTRLNDKNKMTYEAKCERYETNLAKYLADSAAFETTELAAFKAWLIQKKEEIDVYKREVEMTNFNKGIDKLAEISDQEKLTSINPASQLVSLSKANRAQFSWLNKLEQALRIIEELNKLSMVQSLQRYGNKRGVISLDGKWSNAVALNNYYFNTNQFALSEVQNNTALADMLSDAQMKILQEREKLGLLDQKAVEMVYSASLSQFGTYNCDRFSEVPQRLMADIKIDYPGTARISFFVPEINSYIYAYHDKLKGYNLRLPKGKMVTMVVLGFSKNGEPLFESKDIHVKGDEILVAAPKPCSIYEIRNKLADI